jgi:hypothetical protein
MNEHDRESGVLGVLIALGVILLLLVVVGGALGVTFYRRARMEAERARMEAIMAHEARRAAELQAQQQAADASQAE